MKQKPIVLYTEHSMSKTICYYFAKGSNSLMCPLEKFNEYDKTIATYGFKRGTSKFADCTFKLYQAEIDLEKLRLENENQKQKIALEKEKLKAANAQVEASNAQAEAARRNAEANESRAATADSERRRQMREKGLKSLSGKCSLLRGDC